MNLENVIPEVAEAPSSRRWRHAWDVLLVLTARDIKAQYKRSLLGFGWALASPLLQLIIFSTIFQGVLGSQIPNYACFVFIGVLVWGWFQGSLGQSVALITGNAALARQPGFPLSLLPHVTVSVRFLHFAIAMPLLFGLLWWNGIKPAASWWAVPLIIVIQYLLSVGIAYPLASLNVLHRDTQHIIGVLLQLMMFVTPIFYDIRVVPEPLKEWFYLNPMVCIVDAWRTVLLYGQWPDARTLWILFGAGMVMVVVGRRIFIAQSHRFVEEM
ncbi:ABC transporter permease [Luteolibacter luteus]|jgi:lipopolysaccharide transport system permease protein|uniref:Transport permease protein n=1 Tax=Luteolibacter luteus TaxID=2728835 RepID=A0A858RPV7_9BACT|nr:ABC transporter permease [Luteolibacter luteus]QJE98765.1 ABC transporter permease [Luteolibacter luteus]